VDFDNLNIKPIDHWFNQTHFDRWYAELDEMNASKNGIKVPVL